MTLQLLLLLAMLASPETSVSQSADDYAQQTKIYERQVAEQRAADAAQAEEYARQVKEYDRRAAEQRAFYEKFQNKGFWDLPTVLLGILFVFIVYSQIAARRRSRVLLLKQKEDVDRFGRQYERMIELLESINSRIGKGGS